MDILQTNKAMLYYIEYVDGKEKFYCCVVYAETKGKERRRLCEELVKHKRFINGNELSIMGDMNVGLKLEDSTLWV